MGRTGYGEVALLIALALTPQSLAQVATAPLKAATRTRADECCIQSPRDVTQHVEQLGNPLATRYPDGSPHHFARSITDLQAFEGRLYVGHGDVKHNSGPTDIWCYDLGANEFVKEGVIQDHAADHYRVINSMLYVPGTDPVEDWSLGNFYRRARGQWIKHRTLPGSVHSADILGIGDRLYATSTGEKRPIRLLVSADEGATWASFDLPERCDRFEGRMFVLNDRLFVTTVDARGEIDVLRFTGETFVTCGGTMLPGASAPVRNDPDYLSWHVLDKARVFDGRVVYLGAMRRVLFREREIRRAWPPDATFGLFVAALQSADTFVAERTLFAENLTDIAVDDHRCYAVGYCWNQPDDPTQGAVSTVFASTDLKHWSKLFSLAADTFVSALEVVDGDFYLGLGGTRLHCTSSTGALLRVAH